MLENIEIPSKKGIYFSPKVSLNINTGVCEIFGESYIEKTWDFYNQILNWVTTYIEDKEKPLLFHIHLTYFNTSSSLCLLYLFQLLKKHQNAGGEVQINWYYNEDDSDSLMEGEDFMEDVGVAFNLIPKKAEAK